jgi:hypothetical protein
VVTLFIAAIVGFTSCEKYIWDPPKFEPPDTTGGFDTVYYGTDVAPLFPKYNCTGCHPGFLAPDLTTANSFAALTTGGFVNLDNPANSLIITKIEDDHQGGMSFEDISIILNWIYQGAKNYTKQ